MKTKQQKPIKKHPLAIEWDLYKKRNADFFDAASLGKESPDYYLSNRLADAFRAGAEAGSRTAR